HEETMGREMQHALSRGEPLELRLGGGGANEARGGVLRAASMATTRAGNAPSGVPLLRDPARLVASRRQTREARPGERVAWVPAPGRRRAELAGRVPRRRFQSVRVRLHVEARTSHR